MCLTSRCTVSLGVPNQVEHKGRDMASSMQKLKPGNISLAFTHSEPNLLFHILGPLQMRLTKGAAGDRAGEEVKGHSGSLLLHPPQGPSDTLPQPSKPTPHSRDRKAPCSVSSFPPRSALLAAHLLQPRAIMRVFTTLCDARIAHESFFCHELVVDAVNGLLPPVINHCVETSYAHLVPSCLTLAIVSWHCKS